MYLENVIIRSILTNLCFEGHEFKDHLHSEEHSENHVQHVRQVSDMSRLITVLWVKEGQIEKNILPHQNFLSSTIRQTDR